MKVNILGTDYEIIIASLEDIQKMAKTNNYLYGFTSFEQKKIWVNQNETGIDFWETVRHEIIHCFFKESGLYTQVEFALSEPNIDWISIQFPKMQIAFEEVRKYYGEDGKEIKKKRRRKEQKEVLEDSSNDSNNT